jgi:uncharacterized protein (TIGR00255 family)
MIQSMTGFGRASAHVGEKFHVTVTAKSVNHRYLEPSIRLPEFLWELEVPIRALASERFSRGKLDISMRVQRQGEPDQTVRINRKVADAVIPQISAIVTDFGLSANFTPGDLIRLPGLIEVESADQDLSDEEKQGFLEVVGNAFTQIAEMRKTEGESLLRDLEARLLEVEKHVAAVGAQRESVLKETLDAYKERIAELVKLSGVEVNEDRIAQETVILVDKGDVAEELTRMTSHIAQLRQMLRAKGVVGKKLDFLTQEMVREINTIGSKSRSANIRNVVVELKSEVERIREQVQNVE